MIAPRLFPLLALAIAMASPPLTVLTLAGEPGELFPDVPAYDEVVVSPITHPDPPAKPRAIILPPAPRIDSRPDPRPEPRPDPRPRPSVRPIVPTPDPIATPDTPKPPERVTTASKLLWTVDRTAILAPFLSPEEQAIFDKDYAPIVAKVAKGTPEERHKASDDFAKAAETHNVSPGLKRYLMLYSVGLMVRAKGTYEERNLKASAVWPLLDDKTLAIAQARVDCLYNLYNTVSEPPAKLLEYMIDSHLALARYQIQVGFSKLALENVETARKLVAKLSDKSVERTNLFAETKAFVDRGVTAMAADQRWKTTLKSTPDDPGTNTFVASAHLSFYHDIERAAPYAARSDKKEFKAFAAAVKAANLAELPASPGRVPDTTIAISSALIDMTSAMAVPYDKFSVASLALEKLTALNETSPSLPAAQNEKLQALIASANQVIKSNSPVPKREGWSKIDPKPDPASVPKVDTYGNIAAIFKAAPKALFAGSWQQNKTGEINAWLKENRIGHVLGMQANLQRVGTPVERADGSNYVPAFFNVPQFDLNDTVVNVTIEARLSGNSAAMVRQLRWGQMAGVGGYITKIYFQNGGFGGGGNLTLYITLSDQAPIKDKEPAGKD